MDKIRVLIAEKDKRKQHLLMDLVSRDRSLKVAGVAGTWEEEMSLLEQCAPDVVLCGTLLDKIQPEATDHASGPEMPGEGLNRYELFSGRADGENSALNDRAGEEDVSALLSKIGMPPHLRGFCYLRDAVLMAARSTRPVRPITKTLYPVIARRYDTTPPRVERAIRHALDVTWIRGSRENIGKLFENVPDCARMRPTNSECISVLAERLRAKRRSSYIL